MSPGFVDLVLGLVLLFFTLKGLWTGLIRSLLSIAAVVVAWIVMNAAPELTAPAVAIMIKPGDPAFLFATRLTTLFAAYVAMQILGWFLAGLVEKAGLTPADKLGGVALGVATGVLAGCLPLMIVYAVPALYHWAPTQKVMQQSLLLKAYTPIVRSFVRVPPKPRG